MIRPTCHLYKIKEIFKNTLFYNEFFLKIIALYRVLCFNVSAKQSYSQ